jgi:hypothetical protein
LFALKRSNFDSPWQNLGSQENARYALNNSAFTPSSDENRLIFSCKPKFKHPLKEWQQALSVQS